jgi:hypothetical protein
MRRAGKLDLAIGILLGVIVGIAVVYLLVIVVANSRDSSKITTEPRTQSDNGAKSQGRRASP